MSLRVNDTGNDNALVVSSTIVRVYQHPSAVDIIITVPRANE